MLHFTKHTLNKLSLLVIVLALHATFFSARVFAYSGNELRPLAVEYAFASTEDNPYKASFQMSNEGTTGVKYFTYAFIQNGDTINIGKITLDKLIPRFGSTAVNIAVPPAKKLGTDEITLAITKVNGEQNEAYYSNFKFKRITVSKVPMRKIVVEDYTGMWCGWCPRALASLENAVHKYANNIIPIAIHGGGYDEPLYCSTYYNKLKQLTGYPTLEINRRAQSNKYLLDTYIDNDLAKLTTVEVNVSAMWNEEKTDINVSSETIFRVAQDPVNYSLAYVITEDSLSDPNWRQANYLSGRNQYKGFFPELDKMVDSEHSIANMVFRHTAIAAAGILSGFPSSVKPTVVVDEVQKHQHVFRNMSQYSTWKNKERLDIIVLLLNNSTGEIVNANISRVKLNATTGIQKVANATENAREVARYDAWGRYVAAPVKGLNLIKYSNGNVEKVWIK